MVKSLRDAVDVRDCLGPVRILNNRQVVGQELQHVGVSAGGSSTVRGPAGQVERRGHQCSDWVGSVAVRVEVVGKVDAVEGAC